MFALSFARAAGNAAQVLRFWITCDEVGLRRSDTALVFDQVRMRVKTERMFATSHGLVSSGGQEDPAAADFAAYLTDHYDELARVEPCFGELKQLAAAVALAKWVHASGVRVDARWVQQHLETLDTPTRIASRTLTRRQTTHSVTPTRDGVLRRTVTREIAVTGGVNLALQLPPNTRDRRASRLAADVGAQLRQGKGSNVFRLSAGSGGVAVVAPMVGGG